MSDDVFAPDVLALVKRIEAFVGPFEDYASRVHAAGGVAAMEPHMGWHIEGEPATFVCLPPSETRELLTQPIADDCVRIAILYPSGDAQVLDGEIADMRAFLAVFRN